MAAVVLLALLAIPVVEVAVAIQVAQWIGAPATIFLILLGSFLGVLLIRHEGIGLWRTARTALQRGELPAQGLLDGVLLLVAGVLLAIPGFVTDVVALALLVPPLRHGVGTLLTRRFRRRFAAASAGFAGPGGAWVRTEVHHVGDVTPPAWRRPDPGQRGSTGSLGEG